MPSIPQKDRISLCRFTFSDDGQCRTPRSPHHPHFCYFHARQESQSHAAAKLADDLAYFFSGEYISANDVSAALARLLPAIIRGDIKPRLARTVAYLAQTLSQTIQVAQHEYINAFGTDEWRKTIRSSVSQNTNHNGNSEQPEQESPNIPKPSPEPDSPEAGHLEPSEGPASPTHRSAEARGQRRSSPHGATCQTEKPNSNAVKESGAGGHNPAIRICNTPAEFADLVLAALSPGTPSQATLSKS